MRKRSLTSRRASSFKKHAQLLRIARLEEARRLADADQERLEDATSALLDDADREVREAVIESLRKIGGHFALMGIRSATTDSEWPVRAAAAEALGDLGNSMDVHRLGVAAQDEHWCVRASAITSLALIGGRQAKQVVRRALADSHPSVRRYAAVAAADLRDRAALPQLESMARNDPAESALSGVYSALYLFGNANRLEDLLNLLNSSDPHVRSQVLDGLAKDIRDGDRQQALKAVQGFMAREELEWLRDRAAQELTELENDASGRH